MKAIAAAVLALTLAGCGSTPTALWNPDAALLTLCDPKGPMLERGTGKAILIWGIAMRQEYETCAARHKRLVEAIPADFLPADYSLTPKR